MTLHNLDRLADVFLPHAIAIETVATLCDVSQEEQEFRTITYRESEAAGETFLLPIGLAATDSAPLANAVAGCCWARGCGSDVSGGAGIVGGWFN